MTVHEFPTSTTTTTTSIVTDLNTKQASSYLSISKAQLEKWRHLGGGPAFMRYGRRCVRYKLEDLNAFRNQFRMEG